MAVWKLKRVGPVSSATGEPLAPDTEIVTALFGQEEEEGEEAVRGSGFLRKDFLPEEATEEALAGAFCVWHTRTPPEKPEKEKRFDLGMAREFLERLLQEDRDERAAVILTLALLLARKRRLTILDQGADFLELRWPKEAESFRISAPEVSEADAEILQQDLMRLFALDTETAPRAQAPEETGAGETGAQETPETDAESATVADPDADEGGPATGPAGEIEPEVAKG
jgi:hypothetical protein